MKLWCKVEHEALGFKGIGPVLDRSVWSLNNLQNIEMNFCENMKFACWKIIVVIIDYTLNNFTSSFDNFIVYHDNIIVDHGKNDNCKNFKKKNYSFGKEKFILSMRKLTLGWGSVQNLRERKSRISTSFMMIHNIIIL